MVEPTKTPSSPERVPDNRRHARVSDVRELKHAARPSGIRLGTASDGPLRELTTEAGDIIAVLYAGDNFIEVRGFNVATLASAALLQRAIDQELEGFDYRRLLIDATELSLSPKKVNDYMWRWADGHPRQERIAVVNQSQVMLVAVRMRAVAQRQKLKGFDNHADAVAWLRRD